MLYILENEPVCIKILLLTWIHPNTQKVETIVQHHKLNHRIVRYCVLLRSLYSAVHEQLTNFKMNRVPVQCDKQY